MPEFKLPYGETLLSFHLPDAFHPQLLIPAPIPPATDPIQAVCDALDQPVGGASLRDLRARSVAIAINDKTRPVPLAVLLPPLLERLAALGIPDAAITLFIASGTHPPMAYAELPHIVPPPILARFRVVCHDPEDRASLVYLGTTERGTPVWVQREFVAAEARIVVGNLEPHQFMGWSGGVKTAAIGLAGKETIAHNHAMMMDPHANIARYDDNPARQDVEQIGQLIHVHFALNAIVNESKQIVCVLAGEPRAVMNHGIPRALELYQAPVMAPFDLMIASPGGHPKDINLYQAQKALAHATFVTKAGGTVILVAACPEGTGSKSYEEWMIGMKSYAAVLERFKEEGFHIGPHKAFQIARDASRERVLVVSGMAPELVRRLLLQPCASLDSALAMALSDLTPGARVGILPYGNATIPQLTSVAG